MQDEDIEFPQNVERKDKEDGTINFSGETEVLKQLALELSLAGPKLCIAVPYEDASKVFNAPEPTPEVVVKEVPVEKIVEVVKEVIVEKEVPVQSGDGFVSKMIAIVLFSVGGTIAGSIIVIGIRERLNKVQCPKCQTRNVRKTTFCQSCGEAMSS